MNNKLKVRTRRDLGSDTLGQFVQPRTLALHGERTCSPWQSTNDEIW